MSTLPNPLQGQNAQNPLGWGPQANPTQQQQPQSPLGVTSPFQSPGPTMAPGDKQTPGNPAGLDNPGTNIKDAWRNQAYLNTMQQQQKMGLANNFSTAMFGAANPAAQYFQQLMNLGSPYYQQQQRASFDQGVQQNQNAAAQARQQLSASGYGYTPSGTTAATIGNMAQQGSQNLEQAFLQNLFQNEQMQLAGGQGLGQLAALFNPAPLLSNYSSPQSTQGPTAASQFQDILSGLGNIFNPVNLPGQG